jgi:hypothetical protein
MLKISACRGTCRLPVARTCTGRVQHTRAHRRRQFRHIRTFLVVYSVHIPNSYLILAWPDWSSPTLLYMSGLRDAATVDGQSATGCAGDKHQWQYSCQVPRIYFYARREVYTRFRRGLGRIKKGILCHTPKRVNHMVRIVLDCVQFATATCTTSCSSPAHLEHDPNTWLEAMKDVCFAHFQMCSFQYVQRASTAIVFTLLYPFVICPAPYNLSRVCEDGRPTPGAEWSGKIEESWCMCPMRAHIPCTSCCHSSLSINRVLVGGSRNRRSSIANAPARTRATRNSHSNRPPYSTHYSSHYAPCSTWASV